jgi:hypothetical protein
LNASEFLTHSAKRGAATAAIKAGWGVLVQILCIWEDGKVRRRHCGTWQTAGPCAGVYWIALGRNEELDDGIERRFLAEDCILC